MEQIIKYPAKPTTLLNSLFITTVNTAARTLLSVASTSTDGDTERWGLGNHFRYMFMMMTWFTVWVLRVLMDYFPCSLVPSPHYFLSGGGFMALGSGYGEASSSSVPTSTTDMVVYGESANELGESSSSYYAVGRALSHIFSLVNDIPATSKKYQFAIAMAENIVDENVRGGHAALQDINRFALSSAFARTTNLLQQSLQGTSVGGDSSDTWPTRLLYSLPLGSYIGIYLKGLRFLASFLPLGDGGAGGSGGAEATRSVLESVKAEKHAHELLWITNKLRSCGAIDEALVQWSFASNLASSSLMANPRVQGTIVLISAILVRELAKAETEVPRQVKFRLLVLWLPLFCYATNGLAYPALTVYEKTEMEKVMDEVISSLPMSDQEIILTNWLQDFVCSESDWPNLQSSYDRWFRFSRKLIM